MGKQTFYDHDICAFMVVIGPGVFAGVTIDAIIQNIDVCPTIAAIAGQSPPSVTQGMSFLPWLQGSTPTPWRNVAFIEHLNPAYDPEDPGADPDHVPPGYIALRTPEWLYIEYVTGEIEYHDRVADPYELFNTAGSMSAARLANLSSAAQAFQASTTPAEALAAESSLVMGTLSPYSANAAINHVRNKATHTPAATHYLHLYASGSVPISGNGYAVVSKTNNTTTWADEAARVKASGVAWTFPSPTGNWLDVVEWRLTDSATEGAGNLLASDTHDPITVGTTNGPGSTPTGPISYAIGDITITAATNVSVGGFVDSVVHGLLNLLFGGTAYSQLATVHGSYWAGDPEELGSAIAGGSVSITQATAWGSATAGVAVTIADITLADQATGTYWAEHDDADGAGNLLFTAPRPNTVGVGGVIYAGQLRTQIS